MKIWVELLRWSIIHYIEFSFVSEYKRKNWSTIFEAVAMISNKSNFGTFFCFFSSHDRKPINLTWYTWNLRLVEQSNLCVSSRIDHCQEFVPIAKIMFLGYFHANSTEMKFSVFLTTGRDENILQLQITKTNQIPYNSKHPWLQAKYSFWHSTQFDTMMSGRTWKTRVILCV